MKISKKVASKVSNIPNSKVFTYRDVLEQPEEREATIKALNRMVKAGKLKKLSRGRYYRAEESVFGPLAPPQKEVVSDLLWREGKRIGYLSGLSIYPELGLTTQISNTIQVAANDIRPTFKRGKYKISFIRQKNPITEENIPQLQILDAIRYIKKIPDSPIPTVCARLKGILVKFSNPTLREMVDLAEKYPPSTRALLGALLEATGNWDYRQRLKSRLNPITQYRYPEAEIELPTAKEWNIV
ncbi:MAG: DUF6088 family protein [Bacteroidota bacterium]